MCQLLDDRGYEHLKRLGIRSDNLDAIKSAIGGKETKLELAENKLRKNDEKEVFKFYKVLASVEYSLKRNIDVDKVSLEQWVAILGDLSERNKAEHEAINKTKNRR